jgi:hypothetical protein
VAPASSGLAGSSPWAYAPAPESREIVTIRQRYGLFIDGKERAPSGGEVTITYNPATEEPLAEIAKGTPADGDRAIEAADRAYRKVWSKLHPRERAKYLYRISRILQERSREFAVTETMDSGKPIRESRDVDVPLAAAHFWYYAGWADKLEYAVPGRRPEAHGVVGQVIPWNFPLLMLAWKIAPALAAGNTVVLKPASTTPLTALLFADVCRQAELPDGVVNIVTGPGSTGMSIVTDPRVAKVAFTGSTSVGVTIAKGIAGQGKGLTLELGGKAANIVFEDAALDQAVEGVVNGIFFNQGEVCCAGSRLLVQESIAEEFLARLRDRMSMLRIGDPMDKNRWRASVNSLRAASLRVPKSGSPPVTYQRAAGSSAQHSSPMSRRATASLAKRFSGQCWQRLPSAPLPRRLRRPTTPRTDSPPASGRRRGVAFCRLRAPSRRASSGRTPSIALTQLRHSAATKSPATDAKVACRVCTPI